MTITGCQPYRIEHEKRPDFYAKASAKPLPDEIVLADGTIVRYSSVSEQSSYGRTGAEKDKPLEIREEDDDGKVTLRCLLPEHVLVNTLTCLQKEEYQLIYDQLLADETKARYEENLQGAPEFIAFLSQHRHELYAALTRMLTGLPSQETAVEYRGSYIRCRLRPQVAGPFKFKTVDMVKQGVQLKLVMIK